MWFKYLNTIFFQLNIDSFSEISKDRMIAKQLLAFNFLQFIFFFSFGQNDNWIIKADKINPSNYYGITVANGMIGIVSSPEPFRIKDVVLNGAYDLYGRGRVSNFLRSFNFLNMYLEIDGKRLGAADITDMKQQLDMHHAAFFFFI